MSGGRAGSYEPTYSESESFEDFESRLGRCFVVRFESLTKNVDDGGNERLESSLDQIHFVSS